MLVVVLVVLVLANLVEPFVLLQNCLVTVLFDCFDCFDCLNCCDCLDCFGSLDLNVVFVHLALQVALPVLLQLG